jgi:UDP-N-acetylmuramoyl-tripeptide--D-alanyl-D-alanine ligase
MTPPLWTAEELRALFPGAPATPDDISGVAYSSQEVCPGDLFVALPGENSDGHLFLDQAFRNGAGAALVVPANTPPALQQDPRLSTRLIPVANTRDALNTLARAGRKRSGACLIAITGSAGKTTTKDALAHVLSRQGPVHASPRSFNNSTGVPLTLASMPAGTRWGILETGMNHAGEIRPLSLLAQPDIALITTVAPAHLGFFDSEEAIALAKAEIFEGMAPGQTVVLPLDNPWFGILARQARAHQLDILTFGTSPDALCRLESADPVPGGTRVRASVRGIHLDYTLQGPGMHRVSNSLGLLGCVSLAEADVARAARDLADVAPTAGRGALHTVVTPSRTFTVVDESYNANPASMAAALKALAQLPLAAPGGRRLAILGDMRELGEQSEALHRGLAAVTQGLPLDRIITCGRLMRCLHEALPGHLRGEHTASAEEVLPLLESMVRNGDVVMMKGSLSMNMRCIRDALLALQEAVKQGVSHVS